jgi:hypothetical protein
LAAIVDFPEQGSPVSQTVNPMVLPVAFMLASCPADIAFDRMLTA